jgi:hypothetical protein
LKNDRLIALVVPIKTVGAKSYDWKRYWVPRDGSFAFDPDGFLASPATDGGWLCGKTDVVGFEDLATSPCLVLLGEPGIGKTVALDDARNLAEKSRPSASVLRCNLGAYGDEKRLIDSVFGSTEFATWSSSGGELHVFLDSFDECLVRVDTVATLLAEHITRIKSVAGLFFRIASRTAEWRTGLEEAMTQKWGKEGVKVYELAPLTRQQVQIAAAANIPVADRFIQQVIDREVVSFAIKPLTLELLLRVWKASEGALPLTQNEIYARGCLELCSESNPERDTPRLRRGLSGELRLAVATQIAAATVFCKRSAIWTGAKPSQMSEMDVSRSELARGSVLGSGQEFSVTERAVRETLDTGLFTARGPDRLGWAHQTYAEYLAARYLRQQRFTTKQTLDLILHPNDPDRKLVPQLQDVSGWIAANDNAIFQRLLHSEPDVLLRSDIGTADDATKAKLVEGLLSGLGRPEFRPDWWALRKRYRKLKYPGLLAQIRSILLDEKAPSTARVEAIRMVEACEIRALFEPLLNLALDADAEQDFREAAAEIVSRHGDSPIKRALKPLALGICGPDPNDELRGAGLNACWPGTLSAAELFLSLKEPNERMGGSYSRFLASDLVEGLVAADLPRALRWVEDQPEDRDPTSKFNWLMHSILYKAVPHLGDAQVLEAFARAMLTRLRKHDFGSAGEAEGLVSQFAAHPDHRLKVVQAMLPHFQNAQHDSLLITRWGFPFIRPEDLGWLLRQLTTETSREAQEKLSRLVSWVFFPDDAKRIDSVIIASETCLVLREVLAVWFTPMTLGAEVTTKAKHDFEEQQRWTEEAKQSREGHPLAPLPAEHIRRLLDQFEAGDVGAWWQICTWAELEDNGRNAERFYHSDLHELPGWKKATGETRKRLLLAAHRYLEAKGADAHVWFEWQGKVYRPAGAGIRALVLLSKEVPSLFEGLAKDVWVRWMPAILRLHAFNEAAEFRLLTARGFHVASDEAVQWTLKVIEAENGEGDHLWVLQKLPARPDCSLGCALLSKLEERKLRPSCANGLLEWLLEHRVGGAVEIARDWIPRIPPAQGSQRERALFAARTLLKYGEAKDWSTIRTLTDAAPDFGRALLEGVSHDYHHQVSPMLQSVSEREIGALWEWMLLQYPMEEDPPERRAGRGGMVTTRWAVADMRDGLLSHLAGIGTPASCEELLRLINKYPQLPWLRGFLTRAEEQTRRNTWQPPTPRDLFRLSENQRNRLVQSADQLLDAVCESLSSLQQKLQGEDLAARFLWNKGSPKDEGEFSTWVKMELQSLLAGKGIILNREVQIHIRERTDIHVDAVARDLRSKELDHLKVIIEVKGCWNPEIKTAMETQLVNRYLKDNDCRHGIYLVGWFLCDAWSKTDSRRRALKFKTLSELNAYLTEQAHRLSNAGNQIRAAVLDASIPGGKPPRSTTKSRNPAPAGKRPRKTTKTDQGGHGRTHPHGPAPAGPV